MKKAWIILAVLVAFALIGTVSASGPTIKFLYDGKLVVTYVDSDAGYNNEFGIYTPGPIILGKIHDVSKGTVYQDVGRCENGKEVVLYIISPPEGGTVTYLSNANGPDGVDHAIVTAEADNSFTVGFEDLYGGGDRDYNDVFLNVACTPDPIATPEFPTMALPAALIVGILGAVLFIQRSKEN
jgi:hypothetical protein